MRSKQMFIFATLLAVSWIVDYRSFSFTNLPGTPGGLGILAGVLFFGCILFNLGSMLALLVASLVGLFVLVLDPHLSNHETLYLSVMLAIPAVWLVASVQERTLRIDVARYDERLAGVARLVFFVSYYWAATHKWNDHFLDPAVSCAAYQIDHFREALPMIPVPEAFYAVAGHLTIAVEFALPTLLLVPATRRLGLLLGLGFHTMLGIGFPAFQYLIFGFLMLFVPEAVWQEVFARVAAAVKRMRPTRGLATAVRSPLARAALGLALAVASTELFDFSRRPVMRTIFGQQLYPTLSLLMLGAVAAAAAWLVLRSPAWRTAKPVSLARGVPAVLWLLPLAVFLQGLQPHLGIKNIQAFAMFSNLDTDNGQSNHWVIPASWQLSTNLAEPVIVHAASDPQIARLSEQRSRVRSVLRADVPPRLMPSHLELRRAVARFAQERKEGEAALMIDYTHNGVRRRVEDAERDKELGTTSFFERFYLKTRALAVNRHGSCRW